MKKKRRTVTILGASGASYSFVVLPWTARFRSQGAVYMVTRRRAKEGGKHAHLRILAGRTADLAELVEHQRRSAPLRKCGANCICVHRERSEVRRREIELDLAAAYRPRLNRTAAGGERPPQP